MPTTQLVCSAAESLRKNIKQSAANVTHMYTYNFNFNTCRPSQQMLDIGNVINVILLELWCALVKVALLGMVPVLQITKGLTSPATHFEVLIRCSSTQPLSEPALGLPGNTQ